MSDGYIVLLFSAVMLFASILKGPDYVLLTSDEIDRAPILSRVLFGCWIAIGFGGVAMLVGYVAVGATPLTAAFAGHLAVPICIVLDIVRDRKIGIENGWSPTARWLADNVLAKRW
ncbi:hypothetical protein [Natrarchaeobius chitinivorans]|uniref:Uncharacterized protein n=1 Tax=Natrarchaeobius chitinivorans TaxID=1679083 RepID=A0A3N6PFR4_NATCH|nr:hypothetical protein [Natrarchaeobius chitinivorans]RQG96465.1 hypothetical protein EA473_04925 [Natrarchaeobius chitinivorans]